MGTPESRRSVSYLYRTAAAFIAVILFTAALSPFFSINCFAYPSPSRYFYVLDEPDILSEEDENEIINRSAELEKQDGSQVVVAIVDSLEGEDVEGYAYGLFNEWGIGDKDKDNGILILLAVEDRMIRMEIGRGYEGNVNDAKAGRLIDEYAIPYLQDDDFEEGIMNLYDGTMKLIAGEIEIDETEEYSSEDEEEDDFLAYGGFGITLMLGLFGYAMAFFALMMGYPVLAAIIAVLTLIFRIKTGRLLHISPIIF